MANRQAQRESFVVRIWRGKGQREWKGWVQHVRSGDSAALQNLQELMTFLERWTAQPAKEQQRGLK